MSRVVSSKYLLFTFFLAFFAGCIISSLGYINFYIMPPLLILLSLLFFTNRRSSLAVLLTALIATMLLSAYEYHIAASRQSSFKSLDGKTAVVQGTVASVPEDTGYGKKLLLKDLYLMRNSKTFKSHEKVQLYIDKNIELQFGDQVELKARFESIAKKRNFGDFDFDGYYKSKDIYMKAYGMEVVRTAQQKGGLFATLLHKCNQKIRNTIFTALPQNEAALLYGILTGSKSEIDPEVKQVFSLTGLAHILSVSGLHIGFLVLLLTTVLKPFKLCKRAQSITILVIAAFYILLIGAPVPAVRALLMLAVMLGGTILGKQYDLNASASFAAILLLLYNPLLIHDPGYIISFACIFSISFLHSPINAALKFLPSWFRSSLALSMAVWLGITPVLIYYFNYVSFINILLNVFAVPLAFLITLAGFVGVITGLLLPGIALFVFAASYYLIKLLYLISEKALLFPFAGMNIPSLSLYWYIIYYFFLLMLVEAFWKYRSLSFKRSYEAVGAAALCLAVLINLMQNNAMTVNFIDVGQGDCSVIQTAHGKVIVVDGGGSADWQKDTYDIGEKVTVPALRRLGIWRVDTLIVTHVHDDHIGGAVAILESYKVNQVILPASDRYGEGEFDSASHQKLMTICKEKSIPVIYLQSGSAIATDKDVKLTVLAPQKPYLKNTDSDVNNNSLVFKLSYKDFDALFTGDIQQEAEQRLLNEDISCDVLKIAHHGSPYSTIAKFVKQAEPEFSIISVGEKNNYGHPSKEVIERLETVESQVYRTDISGAVRITTNGKSMNIKTVGQ